MLKQKQEIQGGAFVASKDAALAVGGGAGVMQIETDTVQGLELGQALG